MLTKVFDCSFLVCVCAKNYPLYAHLKKSPYDFPNKTYTNIFLFSALPATFQGSLRAILLWYRNYLNMQLSFLKSWLNISLYGVAQYPCRVCSYATLATYSIGPCVAYRIFFKLHIETNLEDLVCIVNWRRVKISQELSATWSCGTWTMYTVGAKVNDVK